jgi:DNA-binding PadR family transcriptional regulator
VGTEVLKQPESKHYVYELSRASGVRSGVMYPILRRLLEAGWVPTVGKILGRWLSVVRRDASTF